MALLSLASINCHCPSRRGGTTWPLPHPRWNDGSSLVQILCKYWQLQWLHDHRGYGMTRKESSTFFLPLFRTVPEVWEGMIRLSHLRLCSALTLGAQFWLAVNLCINHASYSKKLLWPRVSTAFIYGFKPDYSEDNLTKMTRSFLSYGNLFIYLFIGRISCNPGWLET